MLISQDLYNKPRLLNPWLTTVKLIPTSTRLRNPRPHISTMCIEDQGLADFASTNTCHKLVQSISKIRQRLAPIKILMVDEVSMVGAKLLQKVNQKCSKIWSTPTTSDAILGGLPIIIFLGDFNQFEPIKDTPLWKTVETAMDSKTKE